MVGLGVATSYSIVTGEEKVKGKKKMRRIRDNNKKRFWEYEWCEG